MAGIPSMRRKAFIVQRVGGDGSLESAKLESVPDSRWEGLPQAAREALGSLEKFVKLTLPDGSEWLVADETLRYVLDSVEESRAYFATS
jgi:hypothetical protein